MPYIKPEERAKFDALLKQLPDFQSKGELEYCIFWLMQKYSRARANNYSNLHDTAYTATHCGDEFRRRFLDVRENTAINENGDIYGW